MTYIIGYRAHESCIRTASLHGLLLITSINLFLVTIQNTVISFHDFPLENKHKVSSTIMKINGKLKSWDSNNMMLISLKM